jgi:hypothetical protein
LKDCFLSFIDLYQSNSTFKKVVEDYLQAKFPIKTMTYSRFRRILLQNEIRKLFWGKLGIPLDVEIPETMDDDFFYYGPISSMFGSFHCKKVYYSSTATPKYKRFFTQLATLFGKETREYRDDLAFRVERNEPDEPQETFTGVP